MMSKEEFMEKYNVSEYSFFDDILLDLYSKSIASDERLKYVYEYSLNLLKNVCKENGIDYEQDGMKLLLERLDKYNQDLFFKDILEKYSFDYKWFADPDKIEKFIEEQVSKCNTADELKRFLADYKILFDEFRSFFAHYFAGQFFSDLYSLESERTKEVDDGFADDWIDEVKDSSNDGFTDEWSDSVWEDEGAEFADWDGIWEGEFEDVDDFSSSSSTRETLTDEKIKEYIEFLITAYYINAIYVDCKNIYNKLFDEVKRFQLKEFMDCPDFIDDLKTIMNHDKTKHLYRYHGTQDGVDMYIAEKILQEGLLMTRDLSSTSYSEFSMEELLLYERGFAGEIGSNAIVIIDQPMVDGVPVDISEELQGDEGYTFVPSGLQGLDNKPNYIVRPEYIVGYVNKNDKKVIFNPLYYRYDELIEKDHKI